MSLYLEYGGDFVLNQFGGLQLATGWDAIRQRLERAILTNPATDLPGQGPLPADDIFNTEYGAGAQREIGDNINADRLAAVVAKVQQALAQDPDIDPTRAPAVSITQSGFQKFTLAVSVPLANGSSGKLVFQVQ